MFYSAIAKAMAFFAFASIAVVFALIDVIKPDESDSNNQLLAFEIGGDFKIYKLFVSVWRTISPVLGPTIASLAAVLDTLYIVRLAKKLASNLPSAFNNGSLKASSAPVATNVAPLTGSLDKKALSGIKDIL
jgi:hypothetical protein